MTRSWMLIALAGAAALVPLELCFVRGLSAPLLCTVASLLLTVGLLCGAVLGLQEALVRRLRIGPTAASAVRATGAVLPLALVARTLFDGGFASTLPIAAGAAYWVPLGGFLLLWLGLRLVHPLGRTPRRRLVAAALLVVVLGVIEAGDRALFVSEYADVHAFLVLAAVVTAAVALHLFAWARWPDPGRSARPLGPLAGAMVLSTGCALGLQYGLHDQQVRWAVATSRTHARHIARVLRAVASRAVPEPPDEASASGEGPGSGAATVGEPGAAPCADPERPCAEPLPTSWEDSEAAQALLQRTRPMHLLMISVDALRADVLSAHDAERDFPNLSGLLQGARHFRRAFAPSAGTDVSLASLLTGSINPFQPVERTLPEALAQMGRRTHAVLPGEVLRWAGQTLLTRGLGSLDRVITDTDQEDVGRNTTSAATTDLGLGFLEQHSGELADRPFFLWLHYFDVHEHDQIEKDDPALHAVLGGRARGRGQKYRALVKIVDGEIGRLLRGVRERGIWDRTMVVLLADHGESLGEDPRFPDNHGHFVYNALVHVPLALRVPGVEPAIIDEPVSLIDVMPTLTGLCGAPPVSSDGISLLPLLLEVPAASARRRALVINESEQWAVLLWPHKLLVRPAEHLMELYDLDRDFQERHDISALHPHKVRELKRLYRRFPHPPMDRSARGRQLREQAALPPGSR